MDERRKKPGWAFWLILLIGLLPLYPLSTGPATWLCCKGYVPVSMFWAFHVYDPLGWLYDRAPESVVETHRSYMLWWLEKIEMPDLMKEAARSESAGEERTSGSSSENELSSTRTAL